jgi:hypothetical protein
LLFLRLTSKSSLIEKQLIDYDVTNIILQLSSNNNTKINQSNILNSGDESCGHQRLEVVFIHGQEAGVADVVLGVWEREQRHDRGL